MLKMGPKQVIFEQQRRKGAKRKLKTENFIIFFTRLRVNCCKWLIEQPKLYRFFTSFIFQMVKFWRTPNTRTWSEISKIRREAISKTGGWQVKWCIFYLYTYDSKPETAKTSGLFILRRSPRQENKMRSLTSAVIGNFVARTKKTPPPASTHTGLSPILIRSPA